MARRARSSSCSSVAILAVARSTRSVSTALAAVRLATWLSASALPVSRAAMVAAWAAVWASSSSRSLVRVPRSREQLIALLLGHGELAR
jgi:hypothetical protein